MAAQFNLTNGPPAPRTEIMNGVRDQFLAGAGFPLDKNGGIGRRNSFDVFEH